MFGIVSGPAESSSDSHPRIDLKALVAVRIEQFH